LKTEDRRLKEKQLNTRSIRTDDHPVFYLQPNVINLMKICQRQFM